MDINAAKNLFASTFNTGVIRKLPTPVEPVKKIPAEGRNAYDRPQEPLTYTPETLRNDSPRQVEEAPRSANLSSDRNSSQLVIDQRSDKVSQRYLEVSSEKSIKAQIDIFV